MDLNIGLIVALLLAAYVGFLMVRGQWSERAGLAAAVGFGMLIPQVLGAVAALAGSAATQLASTGW